LFDSHHKNRENFFYPFVQPTFSITKVNNSSLFKQWLSASHEPDNVRTVLLDEIQKDLIEYANSWNKDELKMCFISPLIALIHYNNTEYKIFAQRNLSAKFEDLGIEANGRIEWLISKGKQKPKQPFFCLHEYKQENRMDSDPLGQLLVAMVVAQLHNEVHMLIYGSYVVGRFWFFVLLQGKNYSVSLAYDATKIDELKEIFAILTEVKFNINRHLKI
jgi:hypothetical protein